MTDPRLGTDFGPYRIEARLGAGGMGVVYRATDGRLGRPVALKLLSPERAADPGFRERFLREGRSAAAVDHPHIVAVYEAGELDGVLFLAMRYVPGPDLGTLIAREGALEPARAVALAAQVADALDAAHAAGLVHRDVKPANVLVAPGGAPGSPGDAYLTDFGLTKPAAGAGAASGLTSAGQLVGTPGYLAPEQIDGRAPADHRADVYALGCVLYNALTGSIPFPRDSTMAVLWAHVWEPAPRASDLRPGLGPLDPVLERAMAKAPADRYQTAGSLAAAARLALGGLGAAPGAAGPPAFEATAPDLVRPVSRPSGQLPPPAPAGPPTVARAEAALNPRAEAPAAARLGTRARAGLLAAAGLAGVLAVGAVVFGALGGSAPKATIAPTAAAVATARPTPSPSPSSPRPSASAAATPTATSADFDKALFAMIPTAVRGTCSWHGDLAAWACEADDGLNIFYRRFASVAALRERYAADRVALQVPTGSGDGCVAVLPSEGSWARRTDQPGVSRGRYMCARSPKASDGAVVLEWSDEATVTLMTLYAADLTSAAAQLGSKKFFPIQP